MPKIFNINCFQLWDLNMDSRPIETYNVHEYLRSKLCSLYENDCIFDKFEVVWGGPSKYPFWISLEIRHRLWIGNQTFIWNSWRKFIAYVLPWYGKIWYAIIIIPTRYRARTAQLKHHSVSFLGYWHKKYFAAVIIPARLFDKSNF